MSLRKMRRNILRNQAMTTKDMTKRIEDVQNHVMAASISITIKILHNKGWTYEQLCEMANEMVDEYELVDDYNQYAREVFDMTGVGVLRTDEYERMTNGN